MIHQLLKKVGLEKDQCCVEILKWFSENQERRVNQNELTLMGFKRYSKKYGKYVMFSTGTIERKARLLREKDLLDDGKDTSGHTWFAWPKGVAVPRKIVDYERTPNGMRPIYG